MHNLIRSFSFNNPAKVISSTLLGGLIAWVFKNELTQIISAGKEFADRSLPVQVLLFLIFTIFLFIVILGMFRLNDEITDKSKIKPEHFLAILGGLTGGLIFYLIYGTGTLDVSRTDWLFTLGDNAQHFLGWVFYRNDPWVFPIGFSQSLAHPGGACMCFTDSIPLLAIPLKLLRGLLPEPFQYFGWWTLFSFVLQGSFAALIVFDVTKNRTAALIAPLFFCTADILLYRVFKYTPLTGQWIVLFALYLYFLSTREKRWNWLWPLVHIMAVLIQGYFFVMTFVIFCGALLERFLKDRKIFPAIGQMAISLTSTAIVMWVVGFFGESVDMSDVGLGYFKANLNAFINPLLGWSRFFAPLPLAPGTYPNVNYLGIGIIGLFLAGVVGLFLRRSKPFKEVLRNQAGLFFIIPVLVVFALSNVVTWNDQILITYILPEPLMRLWGVFRGTERMLWPVYYLIFVFAFSQAVKWSPRSWVTAAILLAGFGIQFVEVSPMLQNFHRMYNQPEGKKTNLRSDFWEEAATRYDSMVILPLNLDNWARLSELAANNRMTINNFYFARQSPLLPVNAQQKIDDLRQGKTSSGDLYIIKSSDLRNSVCSWVNEDDFLAYVNNEWVLAPGFGKSAQDYNDIAITGRISNCNQLDLTSFLARYHDKLVVLTVMLDGSTVVDNQVQGIFKSMGLNYDMQQEPGMSYAAVVLGGQVLFENHSPQKTIITAKHGERINGKNMPVDLEIASAGKISGEEDAIILVNNRDYSYHRNGLNIAVVDPDTGLVMDTGIFEPSK